MTAPRARLGVSVGITNTRISAVKRGLTMQLAKRVGAAAGCPVCVVGADPTDRDVQRHMSGLAPHGEYQRMEVRSGPHALEVTLF